MNQFWSFILIAMLVPIIASSSLRFRRDDNIYFPDDYEDDDGPNSFVKSKIGQGSFDQENFNQGNSGQGNTAQANFNQGNPAPQGNFNQGNFGQENSNQGNFGQDNFAQDNFNQGNFGQNNFNQENFGQGNFGQGNFGQNNFNQGNFEQQNRVGSLTPVNRQTTRVAPAPPPQRQPTTLAFRNCLGRCTSTSQYNPVCGSDRQLYNNLGRLACANQCGAGVTVLRMGSCRGL